jgi:hypothetical protein
MSRWSISSIDFSGARTQVPTAPSPISPHVAAESHESSSAIEQWPTTSAPNPPPSPIEYRETGDSRRRGMVLSHRDATERFTGDRNGVHPHPLRSNPVSEDVREHAVALKFGMGAQRIAEESEGEGEVEGGERDCAAERTRRGSLLGRTLQTIWSRTPLLGRRQSQTDLTAASPCRAGPQACSRVEMGSAIEQPREQALPYYRTRNEIRVQREIPARGAFVPRSATHPTTSSRQIPRSSSLGDLRESVANRFRRLTRRNASPVARLGGTISYPIIIPAPPTFETAESSGRQTLFEEDGSSERSGSPEPTVSPQRAIFPPRSLSINHLHHRE